MMPRERSRFFSAAGLFLAIYLYGFFLVPMLTDDLYITARYARNLAAGVGFVFNAGERVLGTTTPLLALLMAGPMIVLPATLALRIVSALTLALSSVAFLFFGRQFGRPLAGLAAGCIFPVIAPVVVCYGNEIPLCVALFLFCAGLIQARRARLGGLAAGLFGLARGEGALFGGLLGLWLFRRVGWRRACGYALCAFAVLGPWFLFSHQYFGAWFPRTLAIKQFQGEHYSHNPAYPPFLSGTWQFIRLSWLWPGSVYCFAAWLGLLRLLKGRGGRILLAWALAHTALYAILRVPGYFWYQYPLVALTAWSAGCGIELIWDGFQRIAAQRRWGIGRAGASVAIGLLALLTLASAHQALRQDSQALANAWLTARYQSFRQMGEYLARHAAPGETVMLDDIGIAGFYGWPCRVLDVHGLIHRDLPPAIISDGASLALARRPDWVKIAQAPSRDRYFTFQAAGLGPSLVYERVKQFGTPPQDVALFRLLPKRPPRGGAKAGIP